MGFAFHGAEELDLPIIKRRFEKFFGGADRLPFCDVCFKERPEGVLSGRKPTGVAGSYSFYLSDEGISIDDGISVAFVPHTFDAMDVYLPSSGRYMEVGLAHLMLHAYRYILVHAGNFQMHSAVVIKNDVGIAFCGSPGAGKSTQAHLWEKYRSAFALNLDQPCVILRNDPILVSGSPWSGKEDCYSTDAFPLKAIFFVEQAKENIVESLSLAEAFSHLYLHNYLMPVNKDFDELYQNAVMRIVSEIPIYRLKCTISREAVDAAYKVLFD